jgi:hypothetical protein
MQSMLSLLSSQKRELHLFNSGTSDPKLHSSMPNMSDLLRKRTLADWVVKTKKQVVKLYALAKWSRDADTVQKCMV